MRFPHEGQNGIPGTTVLPHDGQVVMPAEGRGPVEESELPKIPITFHPSVPTWLIGRRDLATRSGKSRSAPPSRCNRWRACR